MVSQIIYKEMCSRFIQGPQRPVLVFSLLLFSEITHYYTRYMQLQRYFWMCCM